MNKRRRYKLKRRRKIAQARQHAWTLVPQYLLSPRDWKLFNEALDQPPEPNEALRRLFDVQGELSR
jgi:uncharacterized protein (DUF1778 family)